MTLIIITLIQNYSHNHYNKFQCKCFVFKSEHLSREVWASGVAFKKKKIKMEQGSKNTKNKNKYKKEKARRKNGEKEKDKWGKK